MTKTSKQKYLFVSLTIKSLSEEIDNLYEAYYNWDIDYDRDQIAKVVEEKELKLEELIAERKAILRGEL